MFVRPCCLYGLLNNFLVLLFLPCDNGIVDYVILFFCIENAPISFDLKNVFLFVGVIEFGREFCVILFVWLRFCLGCLGLC